MKVYINYLRIDYHSFHLQTMSIFYFTILLTELSAVLQEVVTVTVSTIHYPTRVRMCNKKKTM